MAQALSPELLNAVMQAESRGQRYDEKGRLLTSKKGAKGEMQVMDPTNVKPGFGVTPAKDNSPDERARVGRDLLAAFLNRYPDRDTALMAYNWGPGNVDKWLKAGAPESKIPEETRNYVAKIDKMLLKDTSAKAPAPAPTPDRATAEMNKAIDSGISAQAPVPAPAVPAAAVVASAPSTPNVVSRTAAYGPSYQAALAVSMLGDEDEKEDKRPDEPTEAEKFLSTPTAATSLAKLDLSYASPFAEPEPVKMNKGGIVYRADGSPEEGEQPLIYEQTSAGTSKAEVDALSGREPYRSEKEQQAYIEAMNPAARIFKRPLRENLLGYVSSDFPNVVNITTGMSPAMEEDTKLHEMEHSMDFRGGDIMGRPNVKYTDQAYRAYNLLNQDWLPIHKFAGNVASSKDKLEEFFGMPMTSGYLKMSPEAKKSIESKGRGLLPYFDEQLASLSALEQMTGKSLTRDPEMRKLFPNTQMMAVYDALTGLRQTRLDAKDLPPHTPLPSYTYESNPVARFIREKTTGKREYGIPIKRADGSPEQGEVAPTQAEIEAASRPAFMTPSSGIGRKEGPISEALRSGEAYTAAARGVTEMPYNLAGAPMDIAMLARQALTGQAPAGQVGTSEFIKRKATEMGIRPAPPTDPTLRGFYTAGDIGSSIVNPASIPRAAARGASAVGKTAAETMADFQQYNRQLAVPGASYAVRQRGVPVAIAPRPSSTVDDFFMSMSTDEMAKFKAENPHVALYGDRAVQATKEFDKFSPPVDEAEVLAKTLATTPDQPLNSWFSTALPRYLRTDFATPKDQLVRAADEKKLLHLAPRDFSDSSSDQILKEFLERKQRDLKVGRLTEAREAEKRGAEKLGSVAKTEYGKRIEDLTDLSAYMDPIEVFTPSKIPPSMRGLIKTDPEARVTDFAPGIVDNLKLDKLRDKMLEIRAAGPEFSAYGQPPAKVPDELMLPDDTLAKLNVAGASNRVARYTRWQDETRQNMATTALRSDPAFTRQPLQDGKFIGVALPDVKNNPDYMRMVTDVGCDGGWCTRYEANANTYASGGSQLHVIITGQGKRARPVAQFAVDKLYDKDGNFKGHTLYEIKEAGNTRDFANNPNLPAIQEYVQRLDKTYGGLAFVDQLSNLGMTQLPKNQGIAAELLNPTQKFAGFSAMRRPLEKTFGSEAAGLAAVRDEAIRLNNGSQYTINNKDDVADLLRRALGNVLTPQQRATGGMIERQSTDTQKYL